LSCAVAVRESFDPPAANNNAGTAFDPLSALLNANDPEQHERLSRLLVSMVPHGERIDRQTVGGVHGNYTLVICVGEGTPEPARSAAYISYHGVADRLTRVLLDLPPEIRRRLGYQDDFFGPTPGWERALFHLAWHFPNHFCNGAAERFRIIGDRPMRSSAPEDMLQLGGARGELDGPFPGMIFSVLSGGLDLVTASEYALELMREALRGHTAVPEHRDASLGQLRLAFADQAARAGGLGGGRWGLGTWFVRVDSSFHTRPAAEWAGIRIGGDTQEILALSRQCPAVEYCVLRGMWCPQFLHLADLAGALLPRWPTPPYTAPLEHMHTWAERLARRRELVAETFVYDLGNGRTQEVPGSEIAEREWQESRLFDPFSRPVTDDRGNAERWVGFVLDALMRRDPEALDVTMGPDRRDPHMVGPWNCVVTLRNMDLFEASARVIDWMLPTPQATASAPNSDPPNNARPEPKEWGPFKSVAWWTKQLEISADTFGRRRRDGRYRQHPDSTRRSVSIALDDLTPEERTAVKAAAAGNKPRGSPQ
jgi:hypothetical protein